MVPEVNGSLKAMVPKIQWFPKLNGSRSQWFPKSMVPKVNGSRSQWFIKADRIRLAMVPEDPGVRASENGT